MSDIGWQRAGWVIKDLGSKIEIDKRVLIYKHRTYKCYERIIVQIYEIKERIPELLKDLLLIWERSVRATHHFLSDEQILKTELLIGA